MPRTNIGPGGTGGNAGNGGNAGPTPSSPLSGNIAGINPATNSIIANISVGTSAGFSFEQVAVSPAGPAADDVYVVNDLDGTVSVIGPG